MNCTGNLLENAHCYYKLLDINKKVYRQRGMYGGCSKPEINWLPPFYKRFGEHNFPSDVRYFTTLNNQFNNPLTPTK